MKRLLPPILDHWAIRICLHLAGGVAIGIFLHYLFYRLSLPVEPFIYVAF